MRSTNSPSIKTITTIPMIDAKKKFEELKQRLDHMDNTTFHLSTENKLRAAWDDTKTQDQKKKWGWRAFSYIFSASGITALALITLSVMSPSASESDVQSEQQNTKNMGLGLSSGSSDVGILSDLSGPIQVEKIDFIPEPEVLTEEYYSYGEEQAQLFKESVGLSIDVKDNILSVVQQLREYVAEHEGYVVHVAYYETTGTVDVKLPADELPGFEELLKKLDVNHEIDILSYNVVNVSEQVVVIDEEIKVIQAEIDQAKVQLKELNITEEEKQRLQTQILSNEERLNELTVEREEHIAKYNLVDVRVALNKYSSFWEGDYYQYDRSTLSGLFKYEVGRALYSLVRSFGSVVRFVVLVVVYSVIWVPAFLLVRGVVRKVVRAVRIRRK